MRMPSGDVARGSLRWEEHMPDDDEQDERERVRQRKPPNL